MAEEDAWRLAGIVGDELAVRVLWAFYSLERGQREPMDIANFLGESTGVIDAMRRLRAARLLVDQEMPPKMAAVVLNHYTKNKFGI